MTPATMCETRWIRFVTFPDCVVLGERVGKLLQLLADCLHARLREFLALRQCVDRGLDILDDSARFEVPADGAPCRIEALLLGLPGAQIDLLREARTVTGRFSKSAGLQ